MAFQSRFIWTDLSTYQLEEAKSFYQSTFYWRYQAEEIANEGPYLMAHRGNQYVAGIYELPLVFQKKNFPSFWMPYVHVQDVKATVSRARSFEGVTIELQPTSFSDGSTIALIRDPLGAGFTVYEGSVNTPIKPSHGVPIWYELHVSQLQAVIPFYEQLFAWHIETHYDLHRALVSSQDGTPIASFHQLVEDFRGGYEYWIPTFLVEEMDHYTQQVQLSHGRVSEIFGEGRKMVNDSQGASFIVSTGMSS